jgi:hypothetical protein
MNLLATRSAKSKTAAKTQPGALKRTGIVLGAATGSCLAVVILTELARVVLGVHDEQIGLWSAIAYFLVGFIIVAFAGAILWLIGVGLRSIYRYIRYGSASAGS